jgi:phosphoglycerate dehydrogenase-like enzyme
MTVKVGVTEVEFNKARDLFQGTGDLECVPVPEGEEVLAAAIRRLGIKHVIIGAAGYRDALYESLSRGSVIARFGVGHDGVDKDKASARGVFCTNTPGVLDDSVAEYTMWLILSSARQVIELAAECKLGTWRSLVGWQLKGKTLAVIGCGPIGRKVARTASSGFLMEVTGCEISGLDTQRMKEEFGFSRLTKDFGDAVRDADFVSLHIPGSPANRHFLGRERLARLSERAWLINTARGSLIDEDALYEALDQGRIAGAALDVFENEPYTPSGKNDLRNLPNVIMLPHLASSTREACDRVASRCLENIRCAEALEFEKMDLLNKDLLKIIF